MRKIFLPLLLAAIFLVAGVLPAVSADTGQRILSPRFRTLKVMKEGDFMAPPVINPSEGERLIVSFDEIVVPHGAACALQCRLAAFAAS